MSGAGGAAYPASLSRRIIRAADRATLATTARKGKGGVGGPWPYASLVLPACDYDVSPLLLISDLADHTRNLRQDSRVSLLYDGTGGLEDPLTGPRVGLQGEAEEIEKGCPLLERYLRRYPAAQVYAGFADFHLFRVHPVRAHLVAGFGRIDWIDACDLVFDSGALRTMGAAELEILAQINESCSDLIDACARNFMQLPDSGWQAVGVDPEGVDIRAEGALARIDFDSPASTADDALANLRRFAGAG